MTKTLPPWGLEQLYMEETVVYQFPHNIAQEHNERY